MAEYTLRPHPDFPSAAAITISVVAERNGGVLKLVYRVTGGEDDVRWPAANGYDRTDGLWRTTCFEAFVQVSGQTGYSELNFAPDGRWAAYSFDGYRDGMRDLEGAEEPFAGLGHKGEMEDGAYGWLFSTIDAFDRAADWALGLTAVIEATDGSKSYWALAHAPGPPDFHNRDCFMAKLPAPDPA